MSKKDKKLQIEDAGSPADVEVVKEKKVEKEKVKKKRGCCFNFCMTLLIFNFVCVCLLVGVGWYFGDRYTRQYLDMSLTDTFGVVSAVTHSNDKFIENRYTEADEDGFYDALGDALLLNEGAVKGDELKEKLSESITGEDADIGTAMTDYVLTLMSKENLNQTKIDAIGTSVQDANLKISDKELAAFIDGMVGSLVEGFVKGNDDIRTQLGDFGVDIDKLNIKEYIDVDQIKLYIENREVDGKLTDVNMGRITVSAYLGQALKDIKSSLDVDALVAKMGSELESFSGLIKVGANLGIGLVKAILPKTLYLTLDMGLSHSVEPKLYINDMGMGNDKMDKLNHMLSALNFDLQDKLNEVFVDEGGAVKTALDGINNSQGEGNMLGKILTDGGIDCDIFQLLIDLAKLNYNGEELKPEAERISSNDILGALQLVLSDSTEYFEQLKSEEYSYKSYEFIKDESGNIKFENGEPMAHFGKEYYVTDGDELDRLLSDYEKLILLAFADGYGLKKTDKDGNLISVSTIINNFSKDFNADSALDMFDAERIKEIIKNGGATIELNDKMLAALFMEMLPDLTEGAGLSEDDLMIEYIYLAEEEGHNILNLGLDLDIASLIAGKSEDELVNKLLTNLLSDRFIIEAGIDITLDAGTENKPYLPSVIKLNNRSIDAVNKLVTAFGILKDDEGNSMSFNDFIEDTIMPVREVIQNLNSVLPGLTLVPSAVKLPNVFSALSTVINDGKQEGDEGYIDGKGLKESLNLLISDGPLADENSEYGFYGNEQNVATYNSASKDALMNELCDKYSLKRELTFNGTEIDLTLTDLLYILGITESPENALIKDAKDDGEIDVFDIFESEGLESHSFATGNWQDNLKVSVVNNVKLKAVQKRATESDMLTALIKEIIFASDVNFGDLGEDFGEDDLLFAQLSSSGNKKYLSIAVKAKLKTLVAKDDDQTATEDFLTNLLPDTYSLITIKVDITDTNATDFEQCTVTFNADESGSDALFDILDSLGVSIDFNEISRSVRSAINTMQTSVDAQFTDRELLLPNIFSVINDVALDNLFTEDGDEQVKAALSGIYKTSDTIPSGSSETRRAIFEKSIDATKANENYETFMNELEDKYFLKGDAASATTFEELFKKVNMADLDVNATIQIENEKDSNKITKIGLAYTPKTTTELKPLMSLADLGAVMNDYMPKEENSQEPKFKAHSVKIDGYDLIIYVQLELDKLYSSSDDRQDNMSSLINVDTVFAKIVAHNVFDPTLDKEHLPKDENDKPYYNCEIFINDMEGSQQNALTSIMGKFGGANHSQGMEDTEKEVGAALYDSLNVLDTSYGGGYTATEKGLELSDIFSFLGQNIIKNEEIDGTEVKRAIQGMYKVEDNDTEATGETFNYKLDEVVFNKITENYTKTYKDNLLNSLTDNKLSDQVFGAALKESLTSVGDIKQLNLLAKNPTDSSRNKGDREKMKTLGYELSDGNDYIVITIEADVDKFGKKNEPDVTSDNNNDKLDGNSKSILPDKMYLTFFLKYDAEKNEVELETEADTSFKFMLNNMSETDCEMLLKLTGLDEARNNIKSEADTCLTAVNKFLSEELGKDISGTVTHKIEEDSTSESTVRGNMKIDTNKSKSQKD